MLTFGQIERAGITRLLKLFSPLYLPAAICLLQNALNEKKFKTSVIPRIAAAIQAVETYSQDKAFAFDSPLARVQRRLCKFIP